MYIFTTEPTPLRSCPNCDDDYEGLVIKLCHRLSHPASMTTLQLVPKNGIKNKYQKWQLKRKLGTRFIGPYKYQI